MVNTHGNQPTPQLQKKKCPFCGDPAIKNNFFSKDTGRVFTMRTPFAVDTCGKAECDQALDNVVIKQELLPKEDRV